MPDWDQRHIVDCVDTALQQLGVRAITQLIICFPDDDETVSISGNSSEFFFI